MRRRANQLTDQISAENDSGQESYQNRADQIKHSSSDKKIRATQIRSEQMDQLRARIISDQFRTVYRSAEYNRMVQSKSRTYEISSAKRFR
ncbi:glutamyl-tRNA(Gln) amidotransferase subunit A, chloroplastic/mitochondrial [Dorcoceras hygrometricum]|uniref:Glutamyl-tRNA(Gln) amidotransferase subunit A, chloroplastic/mitochondrial n=1 Tax=Dorcoceras hygrometricum TaxID=472368 RepID=A0A2Z7C2K6_9LAMI|nr:glutamyl-tRNA(Gln) amidotransferase subunit A, chloroplastic/mitochondrial [Dorcoceras hygrometricum]